MALAHRLPSLTHSAEERRMMLEAIIEPVVFIPEADQHPGRLPVPRDDDLAIGCHAKKARQVVFHGGQRDFTAGWSRAPRATLQLLLS